MMYKKNKGFILKVRNSRTFKGFTMYVLLSLVFEIIQPSLSLALTEGPSQPEVQSFEPVGTNQMVDLFTGDFNYNIPLFNLPGPNGGYPVNLAYHAGPSMDDEASWVGLGWNINCGSLVRNMRGLPDEFLSKRDGDSENAQPSSDYLEVKSDMKENWTLGLTGSISTEVFGANLNAASLSASVYFNNYNGVGLSVDGQADLGKNSNYSVGLSLDSENGLGVSASVNLRKKVGDAINVHKLGVSFDGNLSLDYSVKQITETSGTIIKNSGGVGGTWQSRSSRSFGNSYTFARNVFSPSVSNHVFNTSLSLNVQIGTSLGGVAPTYSMGMFYNKQFLSSEDKEGRKHLVAGYNNMGESTVDKYYTRDYTRYFDGQITKSNMFLPVSSYDYDVFTSSGQGLSGFFRPHRNDIGAVSDPYVKNHSAGFSMGIQYNAAGGITLGGDYGGSYGYDSQGKWEDNNELTMNFNPSNTNGTKENLYYRANGEMTILSSNEFSHMNNLNLPQIRFSENTSFDGDNPGQRFIRSNANPGYSNERVVSDRVVRNTLIHSLNNNEALNYGEFKIHYFNTNNFDGVANLTLDRATRKNNNQDVDISNHPAGYKVLNDEGSYYVYALPAYNKNEVENLFSVPPQNGSFNSTTVSYGLNDGEVDYKLNNEDPDLNFERSHKFIHKTRKSPYAHSYLLTSVQGADYVDISNNGPSDDDLGYWVKFNYYRHSDAYQWRAPYSGSTAFYNKGMNYTADDDKASYSFGEKELWYTAQIETKTHIAVFRLAPRADMKGADGEHGNSPSSTFGMKLNKIQIYEKKSFLANPASAVPLQEVHFDYNYDLCPGTPNSLAGGKLTLKAVWMTYNGSSRGELSKYTFDYGQANNNPSFAQNSYDPWGNYKPLPQSNVLGSVEHHSQFPYVNQFNQDWSNTAWEPDYSPAAGDVNQEENITQSKQDELVSAWCLKKITLPSGGEINIHYESDDYAYVQHKQAAQMFKIDKMGEFFEDDELYNNNTGSNEFYDQTSGDDEARRRIYFKLEKPISGATQLIEATMVYNQYVKPLIVDENGDRNLYFKSRMRLTKQVHEYVSGYLPLERDIVKTVEGIPPIYNYGIKQGSNGKYGYVTIQAAKKKNGSAFFDQYHPMSLAAWTYLQTNAPRLLNNPNSFEDENTNFNNNGNFGENTIDLLSKLVDLLNVIPSTANSFGAIRSYCRSKDMARHIDLNNSVIRLASPDKKKFGGGHRVKRISITDKWSSDSGEQDRTYGQEYDYTMKENGEDISSGVAQYEPQAGGDENALKYPYYYFDKQNAFTNNNLFTEAPVNENLFPGASVGYRQVRVTSINTAEQIKKKNAQQTTRGRTGGVTLHEFFTAKDFPTIVSHSLLAEENNTKDVFNLFIPIPLVGGIKHTHYHGTQAYMIELNDMHGKPKSVKSYELNNYEVNSSPITEQIYEYQADPLVYQGENVFKLNNEVSIIPNNGQHHLDPQKRLMGVESDLFTDQRETKTGNHNLSINANSDQVLIFSIPIPSFLPRYNNSKSIFRTYVTNKVINRSGILKKTISRDLQASNESEVLAYDEKSGQPLLTKMKNEFGDDFYSYNIPAYYHYDRMGHAYENINYSFLAQIRKQEHGHDNELVNFEPSQEQLDNLFRGDELLVYPAISHSISENDKYKKAYFLGWKTDGYGVTKGLLHFPDGLTTAVGSQVTNVGLRVIRSGRRNHYSSMVANYVTKGNPTANGLLTSHDLISGQISTPQFPANMVLSASATIYNDNWSSNYSLDADANVSGIIEGSGSDDYNSGGGINRVKNPFLMGISGIWRQEKSYSFVGPRKTSADLASNANHDPKLFDDGVFSDPVPMFTWDLGYIEDYVPSWEWVNEVTRYSFDSYETENVNRLGIYSSALYGYDNSLSIAVGGNAGYYEMGFDDFETASSSSNFWTNNERMEQNNLNFYKQQTKDKTVFSHMLNFNNAHYVNDDGGVLKITFNNLDPYFTQFFDNALYGDENGNNNNYLNSTFGVTMKSIKDNNGEVGNKGYYFNGIIKKIRTSGSSITVSVKPFFHCVNEQEFVQKFTTGYYGKLTIYEKRPMVVQTLSNVKTSGSKYHTGKQSMEINGTAIFDQPKLKAIGNKQYIWSMWISRDNTDVKSFETSNLILPGIMNNGAFAVLPTYSIKYGKVVEGWQKVDIEFHVSSDNYPILALKFNSGSNKMYVDDIRYSPKTGGMTSYVYDPKKFWLRANLNVDNYATLFYYDEQGNLSLKKQETEKGIFTISESRGHVSED